MPDFKDVPKVTKYVVAIECLVDSDEPLKYCSTYEEALQVQKQYQEEFKYDDLLKDRNVIIKKVQCYTVPKGQTVKC